MKKNVKYSLLAPMENYKGKPLAVTILYTVDTQVLLLLPLLLLLLTPYRELIFLCRMVTNIWKKPSINQS